MNNILISVRYGKLKFNNELNNFILCSRHSLNLALTYKRESEFGNLLHILEYSYNHSNHIGSKVYFDIPSTLYIFNRVTLNCVENDGYPLFSLGMPKILACWIAFYRKSRLEKYNDVEISNEKKLLWWMIEDFLNNKLIIFEDFNYCLFRSSVSAFNKNTYLINSYISYYDGNLQVDDCSSIYTLGKHILNLESHVSGKYLFRSDKFIFQYMTLQMKDVIVNFNDFNFSISVAYSEYLYLKRMGVEFIDDSLIQLNFELLTLLKSSIADIGSNLIEKIIITPLECNELPMSGFKLFDDFLRNSDFHYLKAIINSYYDCGQKATNLHLRNSFYHDNLKFCVTGRHSSPSGIGEDARMFSASLEYSGSALNRRFDITTFNKSLNYNNNIFEVNLICMPPWDYLLEKIRYPNLRKNTKKLIGYWPWELPGIPLNHKDIIFSDFDEIWVPSQFVYDCFIQYSNKPVKIIPSPVYINDLLSYTKETKDSFDFLLMFDFGSSIYRKNPFVSIAAFKMLYANNKNYRLIIKVINGDVRNHVYTELCRLIDNCSNIILIDEHFTRYNVLQLISNCDAFISAHRSEGFGRIIAEAMLLGTSVIASNWSGNIDFCNDNTCAMVEGDLIPVKSHEYGFYENQVWFDANIDSLTDCLKKVQSSNQQVLSYAKNLILTKYSPDSIFNSFLKNDYSFF